MWEEIFSRKTKVIPLAGYNLWRRLCTVVIVHNMLLKDEYYTEIRRKKEH